MNIYVSSLSYNTTGESLQELFAEYGEVTSVNVIKDRETGKSRGFAFVEMSDDTEGQNAISKLNETEFEGKTINVTVARPKTERSNSGYNNNRGENGGGYNKRRF
ncbi:RNA-binding protein [uncultured Bacteroides sp.]|uniref:RNA recognition motif domain-containing protein n=1 Tax=uncultured Bacteroides sp. TaxID=162156 RepID=UPI002AAB682B|nr:RNA-binding protein [uncultured Bacteroides sp.]